VKPEAKAAEGSLAAPEVTRADASRQEFSWQIRRVHEPADTEYSSTAQLAMQGSVEARGASKAQPGETSCGASHMAWKLVKPEVNSRCESVVRRRFGKRGNSQCELEVAAADGAS